MQWNLNVSAADVASIATSTGAATVAAGKTVSCAGTTCVLSGDNATPLAGGVVAVVSLNLSPQASGNLAVQLTNSAEALMNGNAGLITTADGVVSIGSPISVAAAPSTASLTSSQTQQFTASVLGTSNPAVSWSLNPAVGAISTGGLYTAPAAIATAQTVTITATSLADASKFASVTVNLNAAATVSVSPSTAILSGGQTLQFTAARMGSSGLSSVPVIWSSSPAVGSISSSGVYTAPASISQKTGVTVTATSVQDPTQSASASVTLIPVVVTVTPGSITLGTSQTQLFTAAISGSSNSAVTWKMSPTIGALSTGGIYYSPRSNFVNQVITITATSIADPTKWATAKVRLTARGRK